MQAKTGACERAPGLMSKLIIDLFALGPDRYDQIKLERRQKIRIRPSGEALFVKAAAAAGARLDALLAGAVPAAIPLVLGAGLIDATIGRRGGPRPHTAGRRAAASGPAGGAAIAAG